MKRWFLALVALGTLARVAYVMTAPMVDVVYRSTDDSYYYFNVARNLALGQGLTFDGMNITNGFHPLWMLCILPIYGLFAAEPNLALRVTFTLVAILAGTTFWVAHRALARFAGPVAATFAGSLLAAPILLNALLNGLETGLLILILFAIIAALAPGDLLSLGAGLSENVGLGVLLGLAFLARLDSAFLILGILGLIVYRWLRGVDGPVRPGTVVRKFSQVGGASALLAVPYLAWNVQRFGHAVPISGELKTSFPEVTFTLGRLSSPHTAFGAILLGVSSAGLLWLCSRREVRGLGLLVALWAGCAMHFANSLLFMHWAGHWWHFASYLPLTLVVVAMVLDRMWRGPGWGRAVAVVALLLAFMFGVGVDRAMRGDHHRVLYEAAEWAREYLPAEATVGMTDSGIFGYFYGRRTVNLDGVINGYEYQAALRDGRLKAYLDRCGVTHIADYEVQYRDGRYVIRLPARLYRHPGGAIVAGPDERYRSAPYSVPPLHRVSRHLAIWDRAKLQVLDDARTLKRP